MLLRAILDHVPPIFNMQNFSEVANNYSNGNRSFKGHMKRLDETARKIADSHLHVQIRSKEVLPTPVQVEFKQELDLLLSEVVRILS